MAGVEAGTEYKDMKHLLKRYGLMIFNGLGRLTPLRGVPVLGYHSIAETNLDLSTPPHMFAIQIHYLHAHGYHVVSLRQFMETLQAGNTPLDKQVVLTFDDGLNDFHVHAWPILQRYGFSATVFVPTDFIGDVSLWYADYGLTPQPMMSWQTLQEIAASGVDIQSHGCSHTPLTTITADMLEKEVRASKTILEKGLRRPVAYFCCPQGDANQTVITAIAQAGYKGAVIGTNGLYRTSDSPFAIKRQYPDMIDLADEKTAELSIRACLRGSFAWYVNARKGVRKIV